MDSGLVRALCRCSPLTKSSKVKLEESVVCLPGVDSFNPKEVQTLCTAIKEHSPLLTPKEFFKAESGGIKASLDAFSDVLSVVNILIHKIWLTFADRSHVPRK